MGTNTDLQAYIQSSTWMQRMMPGVGIDSSSSSTTTQMGGGSTSLETVLFGCGRPSVERRLGRPQDEQALKCPRCESTHTKFCYYNNYSLSQPRYFCKTCRRYWTKGGTIRNIPVGGGCRKHTNKASRKLSSDFHNSSVSSSLMLIPENTSFSSFPFSIFSIDHANSADLHLTFPEQLQFSSSSSLLNAGPGELLIENPPRFDIMEAKNDAFLATGERYPIATSFFNDDDFGACLSLDHNSGGGGGGDVLERFLMLPYGGGTDVDVKPDGKIFLSHENHNHVQWSSNSNSNGANDTFWGGFIGRGYGSSATNPLV